MSNERKLYINFCPYFLLFETFPKYIYVLKNSLLVIVLIFGREFPFILNNINVSISTYIKKTFSGKCYFAPNNLTCSPRLKGETYKHRDPDWKLIYLAINDFRCLGVTYYLLSTSSNHLIKLLLLDFFLYNLVSKTSVRLT